MTNKTIILLIGILLVGFFLRTLFLSKNALSFAYDQARDAFVVQEILGGDFKILGPSVSGVPGLYHGVLYYYVLALGYLIGGGSPVGAAYLLSLINTLTVVMVFMFAYSLTKQVVPALISALFFAFSFEASQYANLLTNASMAVWFVPLAYMGLYWWLMKISRYGPVIAGLSLGFAIQSEVALGYHLAPFIIWLFIYRRNLTAKNILVFASTFLMAISPMVLVEVKFGFQGLKGLVYLLTSQDGIAQQRELTEVLSIYLNQVGHTLAYTLFPTNVVFGGLLGILGIVYAVYVYVSSRKKTSKLNWSLFLASYLLIHLIALPFGGTNMKHIMVGATGGVAIFAGLFLWTYFRQYKTLLVTSILIIMASNVVKIVNENRDGQTIFPLQQDLVLAKELSAIDYTYSEAKGEPFSISTLTSPLNTNTLWSYLYNWHGLENYGYLPTWRGRDQVGLPGNNLTYPPEDVTLHFYIIEPVYGIPVRYIEWGQGEEESRSTLVETVKFGDIVVQKRRIN